MNITEATATEAASQQVESAPAKAVKAKAQSFRFLGQNIDVDQFTKVVNDTKGAAGRLVKKAESLGLGKSISEMDGGAKTVVNLAVLTQLNRLGKVDADKAKATALVSQIKALNSIADGLEALGLFKREAR